MRSLLFFVFIIILNCKSVKEPIGLLESQSSCPDDGMCTFEVLKNKSIFLKQDNTGQLYPEITDSNKTVVKFEYKRNEIPNTADSGYREIIYLELDPNYPEVNFENSELKATNALFARLCFCRGQTGYYTINKGKLSIKKINGSDYSLEFTFEIEEVPQVIKSISEIIRL